VSRGHIQLQETLCDEIMQKMLAHPLVVAARVSSEKPDVYPDCASVGVESFQIKKQQLFK
jgi:dihydroneopterin aldolase